MSKEAGQKDRKKCLILVPVEFIEACVAAEKRAGQCRNWS